MVIEDGKFDLDNEGKEGFCSVNALSINNNNYENPDPECDLDYIPNRYLEKKINYALSNLLGFGGHNGIAIYKKFKCKIF